MTYREKITYAIEKRSKERDEMIKNMLKTEDDADEISLFFKSIAKSVKKMPPHFQRRAKMETLSLISNIESEISLFVPHGTQSFTCESDSLTRSTNSPALQFHDNTQRGDEFDASSVATLFTQFSA